VFSLDARLLLQLPYPLFVDVEILHLHLHGLRIEVDIPPELIRRRDDRRRVCLSCLRHASRCRCRGCAQPAGEMRQLGGVRAYVCEQRRVDESHGCAEVARGGVHVGDRVWMHLSQRARHGRRQGEQVEDALQRREDKRQPSDAEHTRGITPMATTLHVLVCC
jgi:hypothetical protein